jgi:glycine oxidase
VSVAAFDVVVVGAGVIGMAVAARAAASGHGVAVVDAREPGREASWAGSGALSLIMPDLAPAPMRPLAARSVALWGAFAAEIEERSGVSVEYQRSGLLRLVGASKPPEVVERTVAWLREHAIEVTPVAVADLDGVAPFGLSGVERAWFQPELHQVRPPRLTRALATTLAATGVAVRAHEPVLELMREGDRVTGVRTTVGTIAAAEVVVAAGAWAGELVHRSLGLHLPIEPVRGQIALLDGLPIVKSPLVLDADGSYLIPRADGRVLAGSTFERVGFDRSVTAGGVHAVLSGVFAFAPGLRDARLAASWAGLRPESPDKLPYLGRVPGLEGLVFAAGHFRDGFLLSAVTAEVIGDLLDGKTPSIELGAFAPDRFNAATSQPHNR